MFFHSLGIEYLGLKNNDNSNNHVQALKPFFLQILPTVASLFFFLTESTDSPRLFNDTSEHIRYFTFYFLVLLFSTF